KLAASVEVNAPLYAAYSAKLPWKKYPDALLPMRFPIAVGKLETLCVPNEYEVPSQYTVSACALSTITIVCQVFSAGDKFAFVKFPTFGIVIISLPVESRPNRAPSALPPPRQPKSFSLEPKAEKFTIAKTDQVSLLAR